MALTEGQCVELNVLASLVAAVRAARERAGTFGVEQRGEGPLSAALPVQPHRAVNGAVCASACGVISSIPPGTSRCFHGELSLLVHRKALCTERGSCVCSHCELAYSLCFLRSVHSASAASRDSLRRVYIACRAQDLPNKMQPGTSEAGCFAGCERSVVIYRVSRSCTKCTTEHVSQAACRQRARRGGCAGARSGGRAGARGGCQRRAGRRVGPAGGLPQRDRLPRERA